VRKERHPIAIIACGSGFPAAIMLPILLIAAGKPLPQPINETFSFWQHVVRNNYLKA